MKIIETKVYEFDELSERAREEARQWFIECNFQDDWWQSVYDDAKNIGLKIESFDLDRNRHATGCFLWDAESVAVKIVQEHGAACETHQTALQFFDVDLKALKEKYAEKLLEEECEDFQEEYEELCEEFRKSLLEDYSIILQRVYEYQYSDEYVDENIRANEYTFTEEGRRYG